jgi:uncharacterized protein (TIGR02588 family)
MESRVHKKAGGQRAQDLAQRGAPAVRARDAAQERSAIPLLEWIVGAVGFLLVSGMIGLMIYHALTGIDSPPDLELRILSVQQVRGGYLATVKARNHGGSTAEGLVIEGELKQGSQVVERSQTTLDYAPPESEKKAGLFFTRDPRQFELQLRPLGYEEP